LPRNFQALEPAKAPDAAECGVLSRCKSTVLMCGGRARLAAGRPVPTHSGDIAPYRQASIDVIALIAAHLIWVKLPSNNCHRFSCGTGVPTRTIQLPWLKIESPGLANS
jgi:hypothetical protein